MPVPPSRRPIRELLRRTTAFVSTATLFVSQSTAYALPQGGQVSGGSATITSGADQLTVTQSSNRAVLDWNSFNVGSGEAVQFNQPSSSAIALNRIHDSNPSAIDGQLTANGQVWLVNPHGMVFGPNASVQVGGLLATTSDIPDDRFMSGDGRFDIAGDADATISNAGRIAIADAGLAALVGPNVTNSGLIRARLGKVQLGSGDSFTFDLYGDGLINLQASDALISQLVSNSGVISADGGQVLLTTAAAQAAVSSLINMDGLVQANSVGEQEGQITLYAEGSHAVPGNVVDNKDLLGGSTVLVSGTLDASGLAAGEKGGAIAVLGDRVGVLAGATLDASGAEGGGTVRVGGDYQGQGDTPTASRTIVQAGSLLAANATDSGNGGGVIVWADERTDFAGRIEAKGGANGGDGGFVETSGKQFLSATGSVDASAPQGEAGQWLLDPNNVTIQAAGSDTNVAGSPNFTTTDDSAIVTTGSIETALNAGTSVTVQTGTAGANSQAGDINVNDSIAKSAGGDATLTLKAHNSILVNNGADITSTSNKLHVVLNSDSDASGAGAISLGNGTVLTSNGGNITLGGGADPTATAARGTAINIEGVRLSGATINAGSGNIMLRGQGGNCVAGNCFGVYLQSSSTLQTTSGTITAVGRAGGDGVGSYYNDGLYFSGSQASSTTGAINLTGTSATFSVYGRGIHLYQSTVSSGSGDLNLNGTASATIYAGGDGIYLENGHVSSTGGSAISLTGIQSSGYGLLADGASPSIGGASATGNITLTIDSASVTNFAAQTTGNVTIKPRTSGTTVGLGSGAGTLNLSNTLLNNINAGSITIGDTVNTGAMDINTAASFAEGVTFLTKAGSDITLSGQLNSSNAGTAFVLASGDDIHNTFGANAFNLTGGGRWLMYSENPAQDTKGALSGYTKRYNKTYAGYAPGSVTETGNVWLYSVAPTLTITADDKSRTYGAANPAFTYQVAGLIDGDTAGDALTGSPTTAAGPGSAVGTYAITQGTLADVMGYGINYTNGTLTVGKAHLTVTADDKGKTYGAADPALTATLSGFVNGENMGTSGVTGSANLSRAAGENVGGYAITPTQGTLAAGNYDFTTFTNGTLTISPYTLSVTADGKTKIYGAADPALTYSYGALQNGDNAGVFSGGLTRDAGETVAGGPYAIRQGTLSAGANYAISYTGANLTLTPSPLAVTADDKSKPFGAAVPPLTYHYTGLVNGDTSAVFSGGLATAATPSSPAGPYAITRGTLSAGGNYAISFADGLLTILPPVSATPPISIPSEVLFTLTVPRNRDQQLPLYDQLPLKYVFSSVYNDRLTYHKPMWPIVIEFTPQGLSPQDQ